MILESMSPRTNGLLIARIKHWFVKFCFAHTMSIRYEFLLSPIQLFRAFSLPFVTVVGTGAVFLWVFCLLISAEPIPVVGGFLHESFLELSPLLRLLLCIWLSYTLLVYLPVAYFNSASFLTSAAKEAKSRVLSNSSYVFLFRFFGTPKAHTPTRRLQNLVWSGSHVDPATKWHPSSHPSLK